MPVTMHTFSGSSWSSTSAFLSAPRMPKSPQFWHQLGDSFVVSEATVAGLSAPGRRLLDLPADAGRGLGLRHGFRLLRGNAFDRELLPSHVVARRVEDVADRGRDVLGVERPAVVLEDFIINICQTPLADERAELRSHVVLHQHGALR